MFKNKILYIIIFFILTMFYFWYSLIIYIPNKTRDISNYFISNESSRHVLKVAILNEKGFRYYKLALDIKDEDILYDSIDLASAAEGFLTSFSFNNVKEVPKIRKLIRKNVSLMETHELNISLDNLKLIRENVEEISKIVQIIEMQKYNLLLEGIINREQKTYTIIMSIIYLSIFVLFLIMLLLFAFFKNKKLEEENLKQQKILLTQTKITALGEMLSNIAHQWRQPLSAITTSVSGLKLFVEMDQKIENSFIIKCSDDVMEQAKYLSKTIDDFNDFINEDSLKENNIKISDTFSKLENLIINMFREHSIKIIKDIENDINLILNDNVLIQSFINICYNAKDAFILNNIKLEERYFFLIAKEIDNKIVIKLKDTAGGIKEDIIEKIFEPYFTTKHKSRGTGIGLYRTNQIITKHLKGSIEAKNSVYTYKNKKYKGGEFTIILPKKNTA